jgi:hypothetical protein
VSDREIEGFDTGQCRALTDDPMSADVNRHIEELFDVPLKEFTSARNAKVAALDAPVTDGQA